MLGEGCQLETHDRLGVMSLVGRACRRPCVCTRSNADVMLKLLLFFFFNVCECVHA